LLAVHTAHILGVPLHLNSLQLSPQHLIVGHDRVDVVLEESNVLTLLLVLSDGWRLHY
jgi:hypothetical protein